MTARLTEITAATILARKPCGEGRDQQLRALNERYRRERWTALEMLSLDEVSADDRLWVCLDDSVLSAAVLRRFAVEVAAGAMSSAGWTDPRSWAALDAALACERGEISAAAWAAAWAAARAAARAAASDAAWDAANDAASDAAWDAAWDAASDAAWDAAWNAAWNAAWDAAWNAAIRLLRQIILRWLDGEDVLAGGPWTTVEKRTETND